MKLISLEDYGVSVKQVFLLDQMTGSDGDLFAYWFSWCNNDFLTSHQSLELLKDRMNKNHTYPGSGFAPKLMRDAETNFQQTTKVLQDLPDDIKVNSNYVLMISHPGARVHKYLDEESGNLKLKPINEFGTTYNALDDFPIKTDCIFKIILLFSNIDTFLYTVCWFHDHYHFQHSEVNTGKYNEMLDRITGYYSPTASNIINSINFDDNFIAIDHIDILINGKYDKLKLLIEKLSSNNYDYERYEYLYQHWREHRLNRYNEWKTNFVTADPEQYHQLKQQFENNFDYQEVLKKLKVVNASNIDKYLKTHYNV